MIFPVTIKFQFSFFQFLF